MNNNESFELEEMRQQMAVLKKKLEQQEIINERMASKAKASLEKDMNAMGRKNMKNYIGLPLVAPFFYYILVCRVGYSSAFGLFGTLCILFSSAFAYWNKISVHNHLLAENLMEAQRKVSLAKKRYTRWLKYEWFLGLISMAWIVWETYQKSLHAFIIMIVTYIVMLPFTIRGVIRTNRDYQKILNQIEELTSENDIDPSSDKVFEGTPARDSELLR